MKLYSAYAPPMHLGLEVNYSTVSEVVKGVVKV